MEEIFNRIISHNRYEVQDRYRDDLKTIPPESRPDVKDITLLYGRHPIYHKSTDTIKPEGRGLTYNFFTKEIIKSGLTDQELTKMVRLLLKGYEQISKFNKETLEREPEEYTSHLQLQPYSTIELDRMPEFLPSLVVALFASEVSRNPVSVIPSLMLLDLIEAEEILSASCMPITWKNCLKHPDYDVGKTQKEQDSELIKLGGLHPMTHQGSYKEFKDDKYQLEESSWSHVKSAIVIIEWLTKVFCSERTMTKVEIKRLSKSEYDEKLLAEQNSVVDKKGELSFNELFDKFGNLKPDTSIEPTKELLTISLISDIMNQVKLGGEYGFSESDY